METGKLICALCKEPSSLKCTGCQMVAYCGREHQKADWKAHKCACRPFQIANNAELGRHLIATRDIKHGDLIMSELPLVIGPKANMSHTDSKIGPCVGCYKPVDKENGARCPKCEWPVCSPTCSGLQDPHHHGAECIVLRLGGGPELSKLGTSYYRYSALLILRCLILQRKCIKKWSQLLEMESHMQERMPGSDAHREAENHIRYLNENYLKVMRFMEEESKTTILNNLSSKIMHQIAGILDVNCLEVHLNSGLDLAALYPTICLLEHSCMANTSHTFDISSDDPEKRFKIFLRAAGNIQKGDHITTMYSHALWGTRARRQHLMESKYFACSCVRCRDPTELGSYISALKCLGMEVPETGEKISCDGIQLPIDPLDVNTDWRCSRQECIVHIRSSDVDMMLAQMNEECETILATNPCINIMEKLIEKLSKFLHPNHYLLYRLQHTLVQLYGYQQGYLLQQLSEEQLETKITNCKELLHVNALVDPYNTRLQMYAVVLLFEQHTAQLHLGKRYLIKGDPEMNIKVIAILKEVRQILDKCKEVLQYELQSPAGEKMNSLVEHSLQELNVFIEEKSITI